MKNTLVMFLKMAQSMTETEKAKQLDVRPT